MKNFLIRTSKRYFRSYRGVPLACWGAIILTLIQSLSIGICYFISLYFVGTLHRSVATAGILLSCYGAGTIAGGMIAGKLSDHFSAKWIAILSLLLQAIVFVLLNKLSDTHLLMASLFILGAAFYGFKTSNDVWMLNLCKDDANLRVKIINISRVAMNLGLGLSGIIIGTLAQYGFNYIFNAFAMMVLAAAIYLLMQNRPATPLQTATNKTTTSQGQASQNRQLLLLALFCLFCVGLMIAQLGTTYPVYLMKSFPELGLRAVSILYLLDTFLIVLVQAQLTEFLCRYNRIIIMGIGAFMMGLGLVVLSVSYTFTIAILSCLIWTTGEMLFMPTAQFLCFENGGEKKKGHTMGLFQSIYASSSVIGPAAGGYIYYQMGAESLWYLCGLFGSLCILLCLQMSEAGGLFPRPYTNATAQKR